jgi:hypothetical protein
MVYQSVGSAVLAVNVFSPVYAPANVIAIGTSIPQNVTPDDCVTVDVDFSISISSSLFVVDERVNPLVVAVPYDTDEVAKT